MTGAARKPTRWSIRQRKLWIPLLGETYGTAYVEVRRQLMHGTVLFAAFVVMTAVWAATLWNPLGEMTGVIATAFFIAAEFVSIIVPTVRLLRLELKAGRHIRANGVQIRYSPDLRDSGVYLAWCRREGLEPDRIARVLDTPAHVQGS